MKLLLLSDINSPHTIRWATALSEKGAVVAVFSISAPHTNWYSRLNIHCYSSSKSKSGKTLLLKWKYLLLLGQLKKAIQDFHPDILHAHYASSYGFLGALSGFHPLIISAWGSDIFDFPGKSFITRNLLKYNLKKSDLLEATSRVMGKEMKRYSEKEIHIVPFGIDPSRFYPASQEKKGITIGIIKSLEKIYGIDLLISAFAGITKEFENTRLLIVGDGSLRPQLQDQAEILGISDKTTFTGAVSYTDVPEWHRKIDIFVNPSHFESFGVSVLEASASGVPVVASDAGGLPEVVENEVTGLLFPSGDIEKLQQAILTLLGNAALREKMGQAGREMVLNRFELLACAELQMDLYRQLIVQ